jgi:hypothetical protein
MERKTTVRKKKNKSKFNNGEILEIYSTLRPIFGDNTQLNKEVFKNRLLTTILGMMIKLRKTIIRKSQ